MALGLAAFSTPAQAFPWDIDMVDAYYYRAYEWVMMDLPEGVVSRNMYVPNAKRATPEGEAMANPWPEDKTSLALGQKMFETYCQTCHGVQGKGGAPMADNSNGKKRYPIPPAILSGAGAVTPNRSDAYIYLTIRNGGGIMPGYNNALEDNEMWAIVRYIRTLDGAQYSPPAAALPEGN
jgi:mono/diheme cytochrome c family protein